MLIKDLAKILPEAKITNLNNKLIKGIHFDSRNLKKDYVFVAISGFKVDGHDFIPQAINSGVSAIVLEKDLPLPTYITKVVVSDARKALAELSNYFYNHPSAKLKLIGVTGTNGKTSTSYLIFNILKNIGFKCGIIGTVAKKIEQKKYINPNTTPESLVLQNILADMVKEKAKAVVMEVSSHALDLHRVDGCSFDVAVFTNLTHDHLDFHDTMENYFASKKKLFSKLKNMGWAIINNDDYYGTRIIKELSNSVSFLTYGLKEGAQIRAVNCKTEKGLYFDLVTPFGSSKIEVLSLLGTYNLYNLLAAVATCLALGFNFREVIKALARLEEIPGRFQKVEVGQDFSIIIDYAHTPDGVKKVLQLARKLQSGQGRVITVLGAAGERDPLKRPIMGRVAAQLSDLFIITEQDSRSENPRDIINAINKGAKGYGKVEIIEDRVMAIQRALQVAKPGDMVLILGKGHEKTLYLDREVEYHGDVRVVKDYLSSSSSSASSFTS